MNVHLVTGILIILSPGVLGVRSILTTLILKRSKECYYETVDLDKHSGQIEFDFWVMQGGTLDIALTVEDPDGNTHFNGERRQSANLNITVTNSGLFAVCFSNEFAYITNKVVYFELEVFEREIGDRPEFYNSGSVSSLNEMQIYLDVTEHQQMYHRKSDSQSFREAQQLNQRVQWAAALMTVGMLAVSVGQVLMIKRFFDNKATLRRG